MDEKMNASTETRLKIRAGARMNDKIVIAERTIKVHASLEQIRDVWSMLSSNGSITMREMSKRIKIPLSTIFCIVEFLERARYVKHNKYKTGYNVLIPLITQTDEGTGCCEPVPVVMITERNPEP